MAEVWEDTDERVEDDDVEIEVAESCYYHLLYKQRAQWTKHYVPVRFWDKEMELYVEGYIRTIVAPRFDYTSVEVTRLFRAEGQLPIALISFWDVHPTYRKIMRQDENGNVVPMEPVTVPEGFKLEMDKLPPANIKRLYELYKGLQWTPLEICSMLNLEEAKAEFITKLPFMVKAGSRRCLITAEITDTYTLKMEDKSAPVGGGCNRMIDLRDTYKNCTKCELGTKRAARDASVVFGRGNIFDTKLFIIGEAPGMKEEEDGIPFNPTAPAGSILLKVMEAAGIDQNTECYLTNAVLCRPESEQEGTQNGKPTADAIVACNSRLKNELALLKPKVVLLLGSTAYHAFYGKPPAGSLSSHLGWVEETEKYSVYLAYHPSYIARQLSFLTDPAKKTQFKTDYLKCFQEIKAKYTPKDPK